MDCSLAGYSSWGFKESDTTATNTSTFILTIFSVNTLLGYMKSLFP